MYRNVNILSAPVIAALLLGTNGIALGANPLPNQTITYKMREVPTDPLSAVIFVVKLELTAGGRDGNWVGWETTAVEFRQPGSNGAADNVWVETFPFVNTTDGLWWIEHADPLSPQLSEFLLPPWLYGTATAQDPADPNLDYSFQGVPYVPPPGGAPYASTAALSHDFTLQGTTTEDPPPPDDDEPVEPGGTQPPEAA